MLWTLPRKTLAWDPQGQVLILQVALLALPLRLTKVPVAFTEPQGFALGFLLL